MGESAVSVCVLASFPGLSPRLLFILQAITAWEISLGTRLDVCNVIIGPGSQYEGEARINLLSKYSKTWLRNLAQYVPCSWVFLPPPD